MSGLASSRWTTTLLSRVGSVLDVALLHGMRLAYHEALVPAPQEYAQLRLAARLYAFAADDPVVVRQFLPGACELPDWPLTAEDAPRRIDGGSIVTRRFASAYEPFRRLDPGLGMHPENDVVWVEHWMHDSPRPRGTLLTLHGFTMGWPRFDAQILMAERWFRSGLDVALMTLPYHGARSSPSARYSGEEFASWHAGRLNEAVRQSVHDASIVLRWLGCFREAPVGVLGMSLGGYVAALVAACHADLAFVIPVVPAVCLADLPSRLFALSRDGRARLEPPLTPGELRRAYRIHSPLSHPLAIPRERALIIAALGDAVTPAWQARRLWKHWGRPPSIWFNGGHVSPFHRSRTADAIESHLRTWTASTPRAATRA